MAISLAGARPAGRFLLRFFAMVIAVVVACDSLSIPSSLTEGDETLQAFSCDGNRPIPPGKPVRIRVFSVRPEEFQRVRGDTCLGHERCVFANQANTVRCKLQGGDLKCLGDYDRLKCERLQVKKSKISAAEQLLLVTASTTPFKLAVAVERRDNVLGGLEYEYLFEVIDPATCEKKTIPLGRFKPADAALSCDGNVLLVHGRNNDTLARAVRVINTRSGAEERFVSVDKRWKDSVELYATGYSYASDVWRIESRPVFLPTSCVSKDPICSSELPPSGSAVAVSFTVQEGLETDADSLALLVHQGLIDHRYLLREKSNLNEIYEEQELQQVHVDTATAVRTGRTVGASYLVLGRLGALDEDTQVLSLRVVSVELATVMSQFSVSFASCQGLELQEALMALMDTCFPE